MPGPEDPHASEIERRYAEEATAADEALADRRFAGWKRRRAAQAGKDAPAS